MAGSLPLAQQRPPEEESRQHSRQNVFYPQARVTLSVVFENFGDPDKPKNFPVQPRAITVYSNSYNEADTFSVEFDAQDLPVTPELIRAGSCEIFLFQTPGLGKDNLAQTLKAKDNPDTPIKEGLEPSIVGLFDEVSMEFSDAGRTITIDGTDYTALFLSKQWIPKKQRNPDAEASGNKAGRIPTGKRLDRTLKLLMGQVPSAKVMTLAIEGVKADGSPLTSADLPIVGSAESKANRKRGIPVKSGSNYWDVMYNLTVKHGFIIFVRGLKVVLTTPQAYVQGRTVARKMAWGRNLLGLRIGRRIGKVQTPIVEVHSYESKSRKPIKARYPANKKQFQVTGLGAKRDEIKIVNIPSVRDKGVLARIAEVYYNLTARSEQTVEIETMDLRDMEGTDLLEMRAGDSLTIGFDPFNQSSVLIEGQNEQQRVQTLLSLGYDEGVAQKISKTFDFLNLFKRPFRVREVTFEWSHDGGLSIAAQLQNFININDQGEGTTKP